MKNNFDLLRLILAATVCIVHARELSGFDALEAISSMLSSTIAVKCFFVVSGFLIFMSYDRSKSLAAYANKRIRRLYPAYVVIIMLSAFGLYAVSTRPVQEYFSLPWLKYVLFNLLFLNFIQPSLPGVFEHNRLLAINGALWTLKIEVLFYLMVPLFALLFKKMGHLKVIVSIYILSYVYVEAMNAMATHTGRGFFVELGRQLPGQLSYFMAGAFFYYFLPRLKTHSLQILLAAFIILVANLVLPLRLLEPAALGAITIILSTHLYLGDFGKHGDFSYGTYITHFPIIQILLAMGWPQDKPWLFLFCVIALTALSAFILWHLVEKRFLFRSSHYLAALPSKKTAP